MNRIGLLNQYKQLPPITLGNKQLRPYQHMSVDQIMSMTGKRILILPTGAGKSLCIAEIARRFVEERDTPVAILTHSSVLFHQLRDMLDSLGLFPNCVRSGYMRPTDSCISLVMEQSLRAHHYRGLKGHALIKDEIHAGFGRATFNKLLTKLNPTDFIGLTATPVDMYGYYLDTGWDYFEGATVRELIDDGYLVEPTYIVPTSSQYFDFSRGLFSLDKRVDYSSTHLDWVLIRDTHLTYTVAQVHHYAIKEGKTTIVYANSINHVEMLSRAFTEAGIDNVYVHSKMGDKAIAEAMRKFKQGEVKLMINAMILTIGFDMPECDCIVLCRPTRILRLYLQICGRVLRPHKGKQGALIIDLSQSLSKHGNAAAVRNLTKPKTLHSPTWAKTALVPYLHELPMVADAETLIQVSLVGGKGVGLRTPDYVIEHNKRMQSICEDLPWK